MLFESRGIKLFNLLVHFFILLDFLQFMIISTNQIDYLTGSVLLVLNHNIVSPISLAVLLFNVA